MGKLLELLADIPTNAVLRERIDLIRDRAKMLEEQIGELQKENAELKYRLAEAASKVEAHAVAEEFVEHYGALFKRKSGGGYHQAVYCPSCRRPMSSLQNLLPYSCYCGCRVDFTGNQLNSIRSELPE